MNSCDKPWVGKLFVMYCRRWLKVVIIMYCGYVMCIRLNLVSPSSGVVSLRPRMGGEPPWFPIFIMFWQVVLELE